MCNPEVLVFFCTDNVSHLKPSFRFDVGIAPARFMKSYIPENIKDTLYGFMPDVLSSSTVPQSLIPTIIRRLNRARATPLA